MGGQFVVADGDRPVLFEACDQPFHVLAHPIGCTVEVPVIGLVRAVRDHRTDAPPRQVGADRAVAVAFVPGNTRTAQAGATRPCP